MASHVQVAWRHSFPAEAVGLYGEIDGDRRELRKVREHRDGRIVLADAGRALGTALSGLPIPPLAGIAADPQFLPREITSEEFEAVWSQAMGRRRFWTQAFISRPLAWERTLAAARPFAATVDGVVFPIGVSHAPPAMGHALSRVREEAVVDFGEWPASWRKP